MHLERVQNLKNANLVEKPNLHDLVFCWEDGYSKSTDSTNIMDDEKVLEALQPHPNLASLMIQGFRGRKLAPWMKNMKNLTRLQLRRCINCTRLPPFGDLPLLKFLYLGGLYELEYIVEKDDIVCQNSLGVKFPSLEHLQLRWLPNLKGLLKEDEVGEMFPNLQKLSIWRCPLLILTSTSVSSTLKNLKQVSCGPLNLPSLSSKLENLSSLRLEFSEIDDTTTTSNNIPENALQGLCSLKKLTIISAWKHHLPENWSRDLKSLARLDLSDCKIGRCLPEGWLRHLTSLEILNISWCWEMVDFGEEFKHLHFLRDVSLFHIEDMMSLPQGLQQIPSLQFLYLLGLSLLTSLPDWLSNLASLTSLVIEDCPKILSLPSSIQGMTYLSYLKISECPELERRCEKSYGDDWPKIAHIPHLDISSPY